MVKRVEPQAGQPDARRAWRVDIGPDPHRATCFAPSCPEPLHLTGRTIHEAALVHLAAHAQHELLAGHLRTCRCHAHGCAWHPRHRGCTGPIVLTVFRQRHGRTWQLADTCTGCARAIPHAAPVPEPGPQTRALTPSPDRRTPAQSGDRSTSADSRVLQAALLEAVLRYLEAALGPQVPSAARILALACLLRADADGVARLPRGLLRALRLAHHSNRLVDILTQEQWLRPAAGAPQEPSTAPGTVLAVRLNDPAASAALAGTARRVRRALFEQVIALLTHSQVREMDCTYRLAVLQPAPDPEGAGGGEATPSGAGCCAGAPAPGTAACAHMPCTPAAHGAHDPWPVPDIRGTPAPPGTAQSARAAVVCHV